MGGARAILRGEDCWVCHDCYEDLSIRAHTFVDCFLSLLYWLRSWFLAVRSYVRRISPYMTIAFYHSHAFT